MDMIGIGEILAVVFIAVVPLWLIVRFAQRGQRPMSEPEGYAEIHYQDDMYRYDPVGPVVESTCDPCGE